MSKTAARLALLFAVIGLGASAVATYVHYHVLYDPTYTSFCDINASVSCTQVYQSRYSTLWGTPVAIFAAIWFALAVLLSIAGLVARPAVRESIPGYLFALSTIALAPTLYLVYVSVFILKTYCPICLTMDAAVAGLFVVSGAATAVPMMTLPGRVSRDVRVLVRSPLALTLLVLFFAGAGTTLAFFPHELSAAEPEAAPQATADQRSEFERWFAAQPRIPLIVPRDNAKVLVVKFNDFQCPACGQSYLQYKPVFAKFDAEHPGAVKLVLKDFPLNSECNSNLQRSLHSAACEAAVAVRLAKQHNKEAEMEEWLYTHQPDMTPAKVREMARTIGGVTDFDAKYASTLELVKADVALGTQLHIQSTPTFFVNGVKFDGAISPVYFEQALNIELQHAQ
jgi:uncharacterized membrane protein